MVSRWKAAADSTMAHLASHPESRPALTFLSRYNGTNLYHDSAHLACFDGGNFLLGGLVLNEQKYVDFGLELVASCGELSSNLLHGVGPENFGWDAARVPMSQYDFYGRAGFYVTDGSYHLRPEIIESFYYAYRATGDRRYQDVCTSSSSVGYAC